MTLKQIANKNELPKKYLDKLKNTAKSMIRQRTIFKAKSDLYYISDIRTLKSSAEIREELKDAAVSSFVWAELYAPYSQERLQRCHAHSALLQISQQVKIAL